MILKEVERVEVTCLVDNTVDLLLPNTEVAHRPILTRNWYEQPLIAEHGFCALLTLHFDGVKRSLLLDSGLDPFAAPHNADVLDLDLSYCESLISSHGHIDHAGGLLSLRKKMSTKQGIPLVLHEDAFRNRLVKFQDGRTIDLPAPNRSLLTNAGYYIVEKGFPNHYSRVEEGKLEPDPLINDDQAIIMKVKDKGLMIITGCGHAGIVNTLNYAKELTGEDRIYAVLGGMHLSGGLFEQIIPRTVEELEELKPRFVVPCHCSGLKAMSEIARKMPDAFIQNSVGTKYIF